MIEKCGANVRRRHPDGTHMPCWRDGMRYVVVAGHTTLLCEQHARQAEAGVNVLDPNRPIIPRKVSA